jgi:nucleoside-diphosphate-sugar epimerase
MSFIAPTKRRHVVITGGAGFLGFHLSSAYLASDVATTILTRRMDSPRARQLATQGAHVVHCDLSKADELPRAEALPRGARFIHLAADVSVNGPGLWGANVEGTKRALELAQAIDASHVTVASSIEALGLASDAEGSLGEEAPCRPVSQYGMSKARAEEIAAAWTSSSGKPALILRIGNIYGPGSAWLLESALSGLVNPETVRHVWPQLRRRRFQPLYVADLVNGLTAAIDQDLTGLYHLTGEEAVTIEQYVDRLARLLGFAQELQYLNRTDPEPSPAPGAGAPDFAYVLMGDPAHPHRCYDNTKLRRAIGPYVRWSLARGLASTIQWYGTMRGWTADSPRAA